MAQLLYKLSDEELDEVNRLFYKGETMTRATEKVLPWLLGKSWRWADWATKKFSWIEYIGSPVYETAR